MKKSLLLGCIITTTMCAQNPVHFRIHSHNEIQDIQKGIDYTVATTYNNIKTVVYRIRDTVQKYQARWNMQVESNLVRGCLLNDNAYSSATDMLQSMDSHSLIEVDPHNHLNLAPGMNYNPYNYADVAHLLDSSGLTPPRTNVGGYLYKNTDWTYPTTDDWTQWKNGLKGNTFTSYTWTPTTLWGGGTPGHVADFNAFGVWRPAGTNSVTFGNNDPSGLINIGNGCKKWSIEDTTNVTALYNYVSSYIEWCYAQPTGTNTFYTASATMNFRGFLSVAIVDSVSKFIRSMDGLKKQNKIIWENLSDTRATWLTVHSNANDYFVVQCTGIVLGIDQDKLNKKGFGFYPNPASDEITVLNQSGKNEIKIYDMPGNLLLSESSEKNETTVDIKRLPKGVYLIAVGSQYERLIKE